MNIFDEFARLDRKGRNRLLRQVKAECKGYPDHLVKVEMSPFVARRAQERGEPVPREIWRSRGFFVQVYDVNESWDRLTVSRNAFTIDLRRFMDGITWEQLMRLKSECGRQDLEAFEIFPKAEDEVNVSNLRHLWVQKSGSVMLEEGIGWLHSKDAKPAEFSSIESSRMAMNFVPFAVEKLVEGSDFASALSAANISGTSAS